jgi:Ribbon-helix-helix domain
VGDLTKLTEEAIHRQVFDQTVAETKARNARRSRPKKMIDSAIDEGGGGARRALRRSGAADG